MTSESMAQATLDLISAALSGNLVSGLHTNGPLEVTSVENAHNLFYVAPSGVDDDNAASTVGFFGSALAKQDRPSIDFQTSVVDVDAFNTVAHLLAQLGVATLGEGWG